MNFIGTAKKCFERLGTDRYIFSILNKDIIKFSFSTFDIVLYYSPFEYEVELEFYSKQDRMRLSEALLKVNCPAEKIPTFLFMSNEDIMGKYISKI